MGIKACDAVNLIQGRLRPLRKRLELRLRQKTVTSLNCAKVVEDHCARLNVFTPQYLKRRDWSGLFVCILLTERAGVNSASLVFPRRPKSPLGSLTNWHR